MFGVDTLVRDETGEDYALKVICDVVNNNMTIVCTFTLIPNAQRKN